MGKHYPVKQLAEEDRPREKMLVKGRSVLTDSELLAILMGSGSREESVLELSKRILKECDNDLLRLSSLSIKDLMKYRGVGEAKAVTIIAALELGNRIRTKKASEKKQITSSKSAFEYFKGLIGMLNYEVFYILLLDRGNQIIRAEKISEGGFAGTVADPKRIFKVALEYASSAMILCHNHPSGKVNPSDSDIKLTKKLIDAGKVLDIKILDHIIVGEDTFYSFADEGQM